MSGTPAGRSDLETCRKRIVVLHDYSAVSPTAQRGTDELKAMPFFCCEYRGHEQVPGTPRTTPPGQYRHGLERISPPGVRMCPCRTAFERVLPVARRSSA